jgi:hypothetical protein
MIGEEMTAVYITALARQLLQVRYKDEVVPILSYAPRHEDVLGSGGIAPLILDFDTR